MVKPKVNQTKKRLDKPSQRLAFIPKEGKKARSYLHSKLPKGIRGEAKWFIPQSVAMTKLQLSPAEFQRICILKGVHPREPKKKFGQHKEAWYHMRDVKYLAGDPILTQLRRKKALDRKVNRLKNRKEHDLAKNLRRWREEWFSLAPTIRERYPSLDDAIADTGDDCLSTLALAASLRPTGSKTNNTLSSKMASRARRLMDELRWIVAEKKMVTKAFISRKGYYFQANIRGHTVNWLEPHDFSIEQDTVLDFTAIEAFVEFYTVLLRFINFRLYTEAGLQYPPEREGIESLGFLGLKVIAAKNKDESQDHSDDKADVAAEMAEEDNANESDDCHLEVEQFARVQAKENVSPSSNVFEGLRLFVAKEVPLTKFAFVAKCGGAQVGWELGQEFSDLAIDSQITHMLVDRKVLPPRWNRSKWFSDGRVFVQPQWLFDSFNHSKVLRPNEYLFNIESLPAHKSPFITEREEEKKISEEASSNEDLDAMSPKEEERRLRKSMMDPKSKHLFRKKSRNRKIS